VNAKDRAKARALKILAYFARRLGQQLTPITTPTAPQPPIWEQDFQVTKVELDPDYTLKEVKRTVTYKIGVGGAEVEAPKEHLYPIYVPAVPAADPNKTAGASKPAGGADLVATTDAYWAKAAEQARSTAKWIATVLGAALVAIVGTAPLSPLGGQDIDWQSTYGYMIGVGLLLLGVTLFMVVSVLVPGITAFPNLMKPIRFGWIPGTIPWARRVMAKKAAARHGVALPIGIESLNELGHRIRIEEMTLDEIAKEAENKITELKTANRPKTVLSDMATFWDNVRQARGQWLQHIQDEAAQWVIVGSYGSVKVKSDRARSIGLLAGLVGGALVIIGYVSIP